MRCYLKRKTFFIDEPDYEEQLLFLSFGKEKVVQFVEKYGEELTPENIDYLTQRIWEYINSKIKRNKKMLEDNIR